MTGSRRHPRPTRDEIDRDVLDVAAGLIARRGVKDTAVQAVADQTGYSKAAVLSRFATKDLLVRAAVGQCIEQTRSVRDAAVAVETGAARDAVALAGVTDLALARPGWAELALAGFALRRGDDVTDQLGPMADALLAMFDVEPVTTLVRRARVTGAFGALVVLSLTYENDASADQARPILLDVAWRALGHDGPFPARWSRPVSASGPAAAPAATGG